ncbi:MAG: Nif3-like dinuclear metal center hexameric protein [Eubacteriales bacterium]|nr:Nif3-like dinuclear metal center hexameric protein [Eubacteriales bacterium]
MTVGDVLGWIDTFAPFDTAAGFDNSGLLIGRPDRELRRVLFCVDATLETVRFAAEHEVQLLVSHHPLLFGGIKQIRYDEPSGAVLTELIRSDLCLIAAHTNLDQAPGGTGDSLATAVGLTDVQSVGAYLRIGALAEGAMAPETYLARLRRMLNADIRMYGENERPIRRVAVGAGALGCDEALAKGADAYVVGEIHHHEILDACARGLTVYEAGHFATEYPGVKALYQRFQSEPAHQLIVPILSEVVPYRGATLAPLRSQDP